MNPLPLQSRIAQAVADAVADRGTRAVGTLVGADKSTVSRWGSDLHAWPADALLAMAHKDEAVREAVVGGLSGQAVAGKTSEAVRDAHGAIAAMGAEVAALAADVADNDISQREAAKGRPQIRALIARLRQLDLAYAAIERGGAVMIATPLRPWEIARKARLDDCERTRHEILASAVRGWSHLTPAELAEAAPLLDGDATCIAGNDALQAFVLEHHPLRTRAA